VDAVVVCAGRNKINRLSMKCYSKINGGRKVIQLLDSKDLKNELNLLGDRQQRVYLSDSARQVGARLF
jgi:hypothetical protein